MDNSGDTLWEKKYCEVAVDVFDIYGDSIVGINHKG
mgnify:CR=1 FL=1